VPPSPRPAGPPWPSDPARPSSRRRRAAAPAGHPFAYHGPKRGGPAHRARRSSPSSHDLEGSAMGELLGFARFKFHEGQRAECLRLSEQAREIVRTQDPGTLQYDLYLNDDQSECMIIERYRASEAAIAHAANVGHLFAAVL